KCHAPLNFGPLQASFVGSRASLDAALELLVQALDGVRGADRLPLARREAGEGEQPVARLLQAVGDGAAFRRHWSRCAGAIPSDFRRPPDGHGPPHASARPTGRLTRAERASTFTTRIIGAIRRLWSPRSNRISIRCSRRTTLAKGVVSKKAAPMISKCVRWRLKPHAA